MCKKKCYLYNKQHILKESCFGNKETLGIATEHAKAQVENYNLKILGQMLSW